MALWGGGKAVNDHGHVAGQPTGNCSTCRKEAERERNRNRLELAEAAGLNRPQETEDGLW